MTSTLTPRRSAAPAPRPSRPWYRRRWFIGLVVAVVLAGGAAGGGIWWFLRDDAPGAVDLESATESLGSVSVDASAAAAADTVASDGAAAGAFAVSGTWTCRQIH